jgi:RNAse (barnase) inhibitor barstar
VTDPVSTSVPEPAGHGVVWAAEWQAPAITASLTTHGWALAQCWSEVGAGARAAQAAIAAALRLPDPAGRNLDALADVLTDLPRFWPGQDKVALLWHDADVLEMLDRAGHDRLVTILRTAAERLGADVAGAGPAMAFESVLFSRGGEHR